MIKRKKKKRVGRGPSSGNGKTSGRGHNGAGSRRGHGGRQTYEGGQARLFTKLPHRGFTRGRFLKKSFVLNLSDIDKMFSDGDLINFALLRERRMIPKTLQGGIRILARGELSKKVTIEADFFSSGAKKKLEKAKISFKVTEQKK